MNESLLIDEACHELAKVLGTQSDVVDALKGSPVDKSVADQANKALERMRSIHAKMADYLREKKEIE